MKEEEAFFNIYIDFKKNKQIAKRNSLIQSEMKCSNQAGIKN